MNLTENQIDQIVDLTKTSLDNKLSKRSISNAEYDREIAKLKNWSVEQLKTCIKG